jgi:hypothetical protein
VKRRAGIIAGRTYPTDGMRVSGCWPGRPETGNCGDLSAGKCRCKYPRQDWLTYAAARFSDVRASGQGASPQKTDVTRGGDAPPRVPSSARLVRGLRSRRPEHQPGPGIPPGGASRPALLRPVRYANRLHQLDRGATRAALLRDATETETRPTSAWFSCLRQGAAKNRDWGTTRAHCNAPLHVFAPSTPNAPANVLRAGLRPRSSRRQRPRRG